VITAPYSIPPARSVGTNDPSSSSKSAADSGSNAITNAAGGSMGKDQFVQLLITQMKNQDPMNPMDGKDLAAQLAQFSSVEQLININAKLDTFTTLMTPPVADTSGADSTTQNA
jgi:flagellar basal-body rod modification protein FlgD